MALEDAGAFGDAEKLGLDLKVVTDAALGNADALALVNAELDRMDQLNNESTLAADRPRKGFDDTAQAAQALREALSGENAEVEESIGMAQRHAEAMGESGDAAHDAADGYRDAAKAVRDYSDALIEFSGWLDKRAALRGYNEAVRELAKSMRNGFTRQDVENLDAIGRGIEQTLSTLEGRGRRAEFLDGAIASLRGLAENAGPRAQAEIRDLIGQLRQLDRANAKPKVKADITAAEAAFEKVRRSMADIDGDVARTTIITQLRTEGQGFTPPDGLLRGFAAGGPIHSPGGPTATIALKEEVA